MNVRKIQNFIPSTAHKMPKVTPSLTKQATKSEQAAMDYFQQITNPGVPLYYNRQISRMMKKLGIKR